MSVSASAALPSAGATSSQVIHCTEELSRTLHALRPNKKRKKNPKLNSYLRTSKPSGIQHRQHTQYQVRGDGSISYTRSYLEPPKNAQATTQPKSTTSALIPDQFDNTVESWDVDTVPFDDEDVRIGRAPGDRPLFLEEILRLEGKGNLRNAPCSGCGDLSPNYRCEDCFGVNLQCSSCIKTAHQLHPLHRLQKWNGMFFERVTLKALGLRIQLGHAPGQVCPKPRRAFNDDFVVMDSHAIHEVSLDFCGCSNAVAHVQQLLRISWFPSTTANPKTAATFRLLEEFHILSFESKVSAYEFYNALTRRTNNTGLAPVKSRYECFMRMLREWRHLTMLKRSGRGHDPKGLDATVEGECAVLCPACPHPGKNLPDNWENAPQAKRWMYALFVAIDANFRLKQKVVSNNFTDPSLSRGWTYFVEEAGYKEFLAEKIDIVQEKSTCSSHTAVNMADTKTNRGLAATGLGTIDCARHNMKRPNAVGDLQKGEKYINMDYLFFSTLRHSSLKTLNISYDIACQWHKKLWQRMSAFPTSMQFDHTSKAISFFVPKFHLPAHVEKCQTTFSFNFKRGVGRTDGEAPERGWANINPVASSTKEMGPGARRDTLDDFFGDWNWKKVVGLGNTMQRKLKEAVPQCADHQAALNDLEEGLKEEYGEVLEQWRSQVEAWENDQSQLNPFERNSDVITLASVRLALAKEEEQSMQSGARISLHEDCSPSILISSALELEEQQRRLRADKDGRGLHVTDNQEGKLVERSNALQRRLDSWVKIQELYMPNVAAMRISDNATAANPSSISSTAESFKLWLPSQIGRSLPCDQSLQRTEWRLRYAQGHDALRSLRSCLRAQTAILKHKDRHLRGQGANTRARNTLKAIDIRIESATRRYECNLLNESGWQSSLRPLSRQDIRSMSDILWGESEGRRKLPWIWNMRGAGGSEKDDNGALEDMRIEWCKARARAMRWEEEVALLREEMRRIGAFLRWEARRWDERRNEVVPTDAEHEDGCVAYAHRQAHLRMQLAASFEANWAQTLSHLNVQDGSEECII
ncbi:hypothetical protein DEU56DRAFT_872715 [Suillus clintonianus]|uniref:uncharacterized protein n=1 Tax=Suillus clintonianus TaxID=1904413 RepID=UPI001B886636|nr:uncharacterized protein DEU56DRAFT_872715 [Suillus clintonianus]KAG2127943.1 hypothetical protein DEU56DRAFT_872715 [Suillus clintonianus]